jgi:excisionase family DNA binding protein
MLTARQVADRLGLNAETVLRWQRAGKLPGYRLGDGHGGRGPVPFDADEFEAGSGEKWSGSDGTRTRALSPAGLC